MSARRRREILERLNTLDAGATEDDRRAEREARITNAVQTEEALKWGRVSAGSFACVSRLQTSGGSGHWSGLPAPRHAYQNMNSSSGS